MRSPKFFNMDDELEQEEIPKTNILFVGGNAVDMIKKLAEPDERTSREFKQNADNTKLRDNHFILREGSDLIANVNLDRYQAILFCPASKTEQDNYTKLIDNMMDKIIVRIVSDDPEIKKNIDRSLLLAIPDPKTRVAILETIQKDIIELAEKKHNLKPF